MTRVIVHEILSAVFLNLLYTSIYSDGSRLYPELNPRVGESFKLVCKTDVTITSIITIKFPDGTVAGYCDPPTSSVPVDCASAVSYVSALNETENAITISTNSLASDVNGTWTCTYNTETVSYNLRAPITEIRGMTFTLLPTSITDNITSETAPISLSATYGCINLPVYFKWFVVDSASKKIDISGTSNAAENSSVCTSGFNEYTETKEVNEDVYSSSSVANLYGSYRLGVEVHYTDEVTTLHSIKYFDTYFVFTTSTTPAPSTKPCTGVTNTPTDNDNNGWIGLGVGIALFCGLCLLGGWMLKKKFFNNDQKDPDPRDYKDESEKFRLQSPIKNGTVMPHETGKSQKKSTCDKRQQPDGHEEPQSTTKDPDARHLATTRPLPPRPNIAAPQTGPFDSVNSPRPITLAPIENPNNPSLIDTLDEQETDKKSKDKKKKKKKKKKKDEEQDNPADEQDNNVLTSLKDTIKSKDM